MSFFKRDSNRTQTTWGKSGSNQTWVANIDANVQDKEIIERAKLIVDHCSPQRYGPHGTHAYSFLKREYLLNLLLFHYADHGFFPSGHICITDEWLYEIPIKTTSSNWFSFKTRKKGRNYQAGWWIKIPAIEEIKASSSLFEPTSLDNETDR
ncbi:hypothetical protein ICN17_06940 [Polynucleobacter sp. 73C-SIWE]|uniref:hypothetical protein n=1 Tax=Polynucleobacter sp. 73C-SIWE TaxID=2689098 RepID=UPI001C0C544B|nr:hypothetical protein [Polynucleobacter sp. 73C-SIWE]MBU3579740.1 hypothetical protein [Polynucleobacter sp. 73C-SIWE]